MTRRSTFVARWLIVSVLVASCCSVVWADPIAPGPNDRQIILTVVSLMKRDHLTRHPMDKEISERCLKSFLENRMTGLDQSKLYFYQSDIDEFRKHQDELCDSIRRGDIGFAYTVFGTFLQRVDERLKTVDELLAAPLDFTTDEQMPDREAARYPVTPSEARDRWRQRIKCDLLLLKTADKKEEKKEGKEAIEKLRRRYHSIAKRWHQIDGEELLELYLTAFTTSFDPHTDYMSPRNYKNFVIQMSLELDGIGASLQTDDSGYTVVKQIIPGGAAAKDGRLKLEDKVVGVGQGDEGEIVDVVDMKISDVVEQIRGKRGTTVRLEVIPADGSGRKIYKITRERIELKNSEARGKVFDVGGKPDGKPYRVGVIRLRSFYRNMEGYRLGLPDFRSTTRDVRKILDDFKQQGVDAVVLDLRYNGGGALNEAISLTKLFIPDGPVVQVKGPDGGPQQPRDKDDVGGMVWSGPLVVVINKFSASASEILAGAIQDYGRGLIVGDHATHGKGTVQSLLDVGEQLFKVPNAMPMGALKITISQFYRPDGDSTQQRGVLADVELPSITTHMTDVSESDLDYALPFDKVASLGFQRFDDVNPAVCDQLRRLSEQRVQNSEKFQKVVRNIFRYKQQKAKRYVTLNEAKFLKERAELNADKEEESALDNLNDLSDDINRDYYLDEILAITADFMNPRSLAKSRGAGAAAQN
jgi:carboxyl-terminal processing protease